MSSGAKAALDTGGSPSDQPRLLEFSPDGRFLASLSKAQSSLVLWNLTSGDTRRLDIDGHEVSWLAFSLDSAHLALAVSDRTVRLAETATGRSRLLEGHRDQVYSVAWSPDAASWPRPPTTAPSACGGWTTAASEFCAGTADRSSRSRWEAGGTTRPRGGRVMAARRSNELSGASGRW